MIRVIIADDFTTIRQVMERMIEGAGDMEVVGTAERFEAALDMAKRVPHDVIILDDYLPPMRSPEAIRRMRAEGLISAIVVVSMHEDADVAMQAIKEGASGYVLKPNFTEEFLEAIWQAHDGKKFSSPQIVAKLSELLDDAVDELFSE